MILTHPDKTQSIKAISPYAGWRLFSYLFCIKYEEAVRKIEAALAYHEILNEKERFYMEEKTAGTGAVKSVFKNGRMPTKEEYTKVWIELINHIERLKANQ